VNGDGLLAWTELTIAWYFWNQNTGAVTWTNPLQPVDPSAPPLPPGPPPPRAVDAPRSQLGGVLPDIDPDLAYLLPADQRGGSSRDGSVQTAQFNSRSGKFTAGDTNYRFDALDEFNRQKRFNDHYFDTEAWEKQRAEEHAKRKRDEELGIQPDSKITKKDMVSSGSETRAKCRLTCRTGSERSRRRRSGENRRG